MDEIQKVLVKAGRKDLAQKYYLRVAASPEKVLKTLTAIINAAYPRGGNAYVENDDEKIQEKGDAVFDVENGKFTWYQVGMIDAVAQAKLLQKFEKINGVKSVELEDSATDNGTYTFILNDKVTGIFGANY